MNLPNDPGMLLSVLNMKLRDAYGSLDDLCEDMELDKSELLKKLSDAGLSYDPEHRCVR